MIKARNPMKFKNIYFIVNNFLSLQAVILYPDNYGLFYLEHLHTSERPIFLFHISCFLNALKPYNVRPSSVIYSLLNVPFHFNSSRCKKTFSGLDWTNVHIAVANNLCSFLKTPLNCSQPAPYIIFDSTNTHQFFFRYTCVDLHYAFASIYR